MRQFRKLSLFSLGLLTVISVKSAVALAFAFGEPHCPYNQIKPENICQISTAAKKNIETIFTVAKNNCLETVESDLCKESLEKFPFLNEHTNKCDIDGVCGIQFSTNGSQAIKGCELGINQAYLHLGKKIADASAVAEALAKQLQGEFWNFFIKLPDFTWTAIEDCLFSDSICSVNKLKQYLTDLPSQAKKELKQMVAYLKSLDCLDQVGRYKLICYQASLETSGIAINSIPGGVVSKVASKFLPDLKRFKIADKGTKAANASELVGLRKLEKLFGRKVILTTKYRDNDKQPIFILSDPNTGEQMGMLTTLFFPGSNRLELQTMVTEEKYRRLGVGEGLLESALMKFPNTKIIAVDVLEDSNRTAVVDAIEKGLSVEEAIKASPAYKIRAKYGFTDIVPGSIDETYFGFKVQRPEP